MSDNPTRGTPDSRSFEERVFARFDALDARMDRFESRLDSLERKVDALDGRLTALEEKVDSRLRETRPIWEAMQEQLKRLNSKVDILISDFYETRTDIAGHEKRLTILEGQRAQ
jgi:predicted  nucleic acid-binding Zn-ribbon protein